MSDKKTQKHWPFHLDAVGKLRTVRLVVFSVFIWSLFVPTFSILLDFQAYNLTAEAKAVIGTANSNLSAKFTYSDKNHAWVFNRDGLGVQAEQLVEAQGSSTSDAAGALKQLRAQVGGGGEKDDSLYSASLPVKGSEGVRYFDNNTGESFTMTPEFGLGEGKKWQGRVIYPIHGGGQLVYTAKTNGLKEDIVLGKSRGDELSFGYKLDLPKTLEARLLDDGSIGVFSADPALFTASAGNSEDQAKLANAQQTASKDHLMFALPAPVIKDAKGKELKGTFTLHGDTLTLYAHGLNDLAYPASIDPSVVITSSSGFATGNNESAIDYSTSGQINGMQVTGGSVGAWNTTTVSPNGGDACMVTAVYNGYLYRLTNGVGYSALINANGTLGSWNSITNGNASCAGGTAYNGYIYVVGGTDSGGLTATVSYAQANTNGTLGSWTATSSLPAIRSSLVAVAYNGYLYAMGGYDGSVHNDVYYAPINANGTLGSWTATSSFATARSALGGFAYNGYLYIMGGYNGSSTYYNDVQYAKINSNGTLSSWMTTTSFGTARAASVVTVYNGYAYIAGGTTNTTTSQSDTQYAQISANGTIGTWYTSTALGTGVWGAGGATYKGYLYVVNGHPTAGNTYTTSVQYAKISQPGTTTAWTTSGNTFTTARALSCSVAYNGYLYNLGGSTTDGMGNNVTTVQYAAIAADGTIGTWGSTTVLPEARGSFGCVAYNGRLYVVGGYTGTSTTGTALATTRYISINSNGTLAASWTNGTALSETVSDNVNAFTYTTPDGTTRLYLGGSRGNSSIDVMYSTINASTGALGTFSLTSSPTDVTTGLNQGRFALVGNHMYYYGTENGSQVFTNQVWYSTIASNGTLSTWQTTANLPSALAWTSSVTVNGCIYAIGGWNSTSSATVKTVYFACPNADGTISSWYSAPDLAVATEDMGVASFNGVIYAVGGYTTAVVNTVKYAFVNNGGSGAALSNWGTTGTSLSSTRQGGSVIAYNDYLYAVGGDRTWIEYAPINPDGTTGSWVVDNSHNLSTERRNAGVAAYNGYMYVLGGNIDGGEYFKSILYAPIASNGALGAAWASAGGDVSNGGQGVGLVAYNGYLYSLGGWDGITDHNMVQYAAINTDGTIGSWQTATSFDIGRSNAAAFAYGGYMYILGGNGSTNYNTTQYAPINGDGSLGTWQYTSSFATARVDATVAAYNGFIYLAGGWDNSNRTGYGDTQYAPINADGTVGPWQQALKTVAPGGTSYVPAGKRASSAQSVYNGYLYGVAGDEYGSTDYNGAMMLPLGSIARKAQYSRLIALGSPATNVTVNYNGSSNPGGTTLKFMTAGSNGVFGSLTTGTAGAGVDPGMVCGTASITSVWVQMTIDDSSRASFGGGTSSYVNDITAYYGLSARPQPNQRLHGGKFFSSGIMQPLDTCGNT